MRFYLSARLMLDKHADSPAPTGLNTNSGGSPNCIDQKSTKGHPKSTPKSLLTTLNTQNSTLFPEVLPTVRDRDKSHLLHTPISVLHFFSLGNTV